MKRLSLALLIAAVAAGIVVAAALSAGHSGLGSDQAVLSNDARLPLVLTSPIPEYGLDFISAADAPASEHRYQRGLSTGAGWNRWPLYWYNVETSPGVWTWSAADAVVQADLAHGLHTDLILLGTPGFYGTGGSTAIPPPQVGQRPAGWWEPVSRMAPASPASTTPIGLYLAVFSDGTDEPGPGKTINPDNVWARFVYAVVSRYAPMGIDYYEVWNEPDLTFFWNGTIAEYARLLKVAYLAAEQADPAVQVLVGGLANFEQPNFLRDVLNVLAADPMAPGHQWFFDIVATHSYSYAWESWYHVWRAGRTLSTYGLGKSIWLNESGSPAWDDYPGPVWDPNSGYRSTMAEGAAYVIQSALYARYAGAAVVFHFQLYDDCGNDPQGTDFPPYPICNPASDPVCGGDAFGLFRNPTDGPCYRQHPNPDTPRPVYDAYRVLTLRLQGLEPLWRQRPGGVDPYNGPQEWIAFYQPATHSRILGLWARFGDPQTAIVPATGDSAQLIDQTGAVTPLTPVGGSYTVPLGPATNRNLTHDPTIYAIGGPPLLLVEPDTQPPTTEITVPPPPAHPTIPVAWSGQDLGSGVADYSIWVNVNGGPMTLWLGNTTATSASYLGQPGHTYGFAVEARDKAGNWGATPTAPQVTTTVATEIVHLPMIVVSYSP